MAKEEEKQMGIDGVYTMLKAMRDRMYENGEQTVTLNQAEFFAIYQIACYLMQIRHIIKDQE